MIFMDADRIGFRTGKSLAIDVTSCRGELTEIPKAFRAIMYAVKNNHAFLW